MGDGDVKGILLPEIMMMKDGGILPAVFISVL
jgi:hypothetical protein